jgi:hypothetical protein
MGPGLRLRLDQPPLGQIHFRRENVQSNAP